MRSVDSPNYKITGSLEEPININLDAFPLFKQRVYGQPGTVDNGRLIEVYHYKNFDGENYLDLVVKETISYTDINNFLAIKTITVDFYKENDVVGSSQTKHKYYTGDEGMLESIEEGEIRRKYLIKKGKLYLLGQIGVEAGILLFTQLKNEIQQYEAVNNQADLFAAINATSLTEIQKQTLIYLLTY